MLPIPDSRNSNKTYGTAILSFLDEGGVLGLVSDFDITVILLHNILCLHFEGGHATIRPLACAH